MKQITKAKKEVEKLSKIIREKLQNPNIKFKHIDYCNSFSLETENNKHIIRISYDRENNKYQLITMVRETENRSEILLFLNELTLNELLEKIPYAYGGFDMNIYLLKYHKDFITDKKGMVNQLNKLFDIENKGLKLIKEGVN